MKADIKHSTDGSIRFIEIRLSNGDIFKIREYKFGGLEINKYGFAEDGIKVIPRVSNEIVVE